MPDTSITPYVGVTQITGERYGYKFSCLLIDTRNRRVYIPNTQGTLIRPSDLAKQTGAIIAMARSFDLEVVAEGVEKDEQLTFLRSQSCDSVQGFLLSRPMPADELTKMLG